MVLVEKYIEGLKLGKELSKLVLKRYKDFLWGFDVLEELIDDPDITDIHCISHKNIRVKSIIDKRAVRHQAHVRFETKEHFTRFIEHLAIRNKINLSEQNAQQHFVDMMAHPHFRMRCDITTEFISCSGEPFLHIRKEAKSKKYIRDLIADEMFSEQLWKTHIHSAINGPIIISGNSGSGKSIFINAAIEELPDEVNGLIIQADNELFSEKHPDIIAFHTVTRRGTGISYGFSEIAENGMLMDREYLIFSEVKGKEAADVFKAAHTGHNPWLSLHAPNNRAALYQFGNYTKISADISLEDFFRMIADLNFTLIHISDFKIDELTRVVGWDDDLKRIKFEDIEI